MHYYPHHVGDYQRDTAHLSILDHGVYRLLMDHYYVTERPLPTDLPSLCRIIRALSTPEKKSMQKILHEFFQLGPDGYFHRRIDREIAKYGVDCEKNRRNGAKGGRPKKEPSGKPNENPVGYFSLTQGVTQTKGNQNQNQEPKESPLPPLGDEGEILKASERIIRLYPRPGNDMQILPVIRGILKTMDAEKLYHLVLDCVDAMKTAPGGVHNKYFPAKLKFFEERYFDHPGLFVERARDNGGKNGKYKAQFPTGI